MPIWVLSFGDMITNLLAFFILLQSFSKLQEAEFLYAGMNGLVSVGPKGSPERSLGQLPDPGWAAPRAQHATDGDPQNLFPERIIDAEDEKIRRIFDELRKSMQTETSGSDKTELRLFSTPIAFRPSQWALDAAAREFLAQFAADLRNNPAAPRVEVYIIAIASEATSRQAQYVLSAKRAQAVGEHLSAILAADGRTRSTRILAWGAGPGGRGPYASETTPHPPVIIAVAAPVS